MPDYSFILIEILSAETDPGFVGPEAYTIWELFLKKEMQNQFQSLKRVHASEGPKSLSFISF